MGRRYVDAERGATNTVTSVSLRCLALFHRGNSHYCRALFEGGRETCTLTCFMYAALVNLSKANLQISAPSMSPCHRIHAPCAPKYYNVRPAGNRANILLPTTTMIHTTLSARQQPWPDVR